MYIYNYVCIVIVIAKFISKYKDTCKARRTKVFRHKKFIKAY